MLSVIIVKRPLMSPGVITKYHCWFIQASVLTHPGAGNEDETHNTHHKTIILQKQIIISQND